MKIAIPTIGKGGLGAERSGHFGHCDVFSIVEISDGKVVGISELENPPHEEGGCTRPVKLLYEAGIDGIVAAGMGMRPMRAFADAGISVYYDTQTPNVGDVARLVAAGKVPVMTPENACRH
ncbi:MAG: NifB/NifX family molybdenum-iron cluster-binding protein [Coriobacteriales bacterium]